MSAAVASCAATCCTLSVCECIKDSTKNIGMRGAKIIYSIFLALSIMLTFIFNNYTNNLLEKLPAFAQKEISPQVLGSHGAARIAFGGFTFFITQALFSLSPHYQTNFWILKTIYWLASHIWPLFLPLNFTAGYMGAALFLSIGFLILQCLINLDFAYAFSDSWINKAYPDDLVSNHSQFSKIVLWILTSILILSSIAASIVNICMYNNSSINLLVTISNLLLTQITLIFSVSGWNKSNILMGSLVAAYNNYITWKTLNNIDEQNIVETLVSVFCIIYTGISLSSGMRAITFSDHENLISVNPRTRRRRKLSDDLPESSSELDNDQTNKILMEANELEEHKKNKTANIFCHLVFGLSIMYSSMLFTNWNAHSGESLWINISMMWGMYLLYIWTIVAPSVLTSREFK